MKKIISVFLVLLAAIVLVACGEKEKNNGELIDFGDRITKKSEIRVWMDDEKGEYMEELIAEFNKIYPNIVVTHQHKGTVDSREHLKTFGPSGNGADVFQFPHDHLAQAVLEDLVYALPSSTKTLLEERAHETGLDIATLMYNPDNLENPFDPTDQNAVETLFAVPVSLESVGLYYNKAMITEPATTFEELLAAGKTWNQEPGHADQGIYYLGTSSHWADSYFMQFAYSAFDFYPFGSNLNDASAVGFTNAQSALQWFQDELKPVTTGAGTHNSVSGGTNFEQGKIPYVIAGPWNNEAYKAAGLDYGIAPLPTINGKQTRTFAGAMMTAVYKYSDNKEDAIKFVEFLNSDAAMEIQYRLKSKLPALKKELLSNIEGVSEDPLMIAMSAQLESSIPMPTIPQVTYYWGPGETMITAIWNGTATSIAAEVAKAEQSYRTSAGLAS